MERASAITNAFKVLRSIIGCIQHTQGKQQGSKKKSPTILDILAMDAKSYNSERFGMTQVGRKQMLIIVS